VAVVMHGFEMVLALAALVAGAIASVAGFGIGSVLTPLLATIVGTKTAVAAVSIPHLVATALRLWMVREHIDRGVLLSFGVTSAIGGLVGALLHTTFSSVILTYILALLLIFAGVMGLTGMMERVHFGRKSAWTAGALSGALGGLVGNQGGIRSAAMLGFGVPRQAFVATATAIALAVDAARMPVYAYSERSSVMAIWGAVLIMTIGVIVGTVFGKGVLERIPEKTFRRSVSALVLALGVSMFLIRAH
jgi:uncharacterized protein